MPDTHINAYFAEVEDKKHIFNQAQRDLEEAHARLEAKKKEVGWQDPEEVESKEAADKKGAAGFGFGKRKPKETIDENSL